MYSHVLDFPECFLALLLWLGIDTKPFVIQMYKYIYVCMYVYTYIWKRVWVVSINLVHTTFPSNGGLPVKLLYCFLNKANH